MERVSKPEPLAMARVRHWTLAGVTFPQPLDTRVVFFSVRPYALDFVTMAEAAEMRPDQAEGWHVHVKQI